jgi:hypothetical protein
MVAHVEQGYLTHAVEIRRGGEPVAVLLDPQAARCAVAIADRLRGRKPPFTQDALNEWIDEVLADFDVPAFMSGGCRARLGEALRGATTHFVEKEAGMSKMDSLITSVQSTPPKMIVYGQPGIGKTTFAASAGAVLLDCENGAGAVPGLRRTPYLETWPQIREWLAELASEKPDDVDAVAIDTVDWLVQRVIEYVVIDLDGKTPGDITNTLGTAHGGYFKAREVAQNIIYRDVLPMLNAINGAGAVVILLGHASNIRMTTPEGYDHRLVRLPDVLGQFPHRVADLVVDSLEH